MADLTNPRLIYLKGFLFLFAGLLASLVLIWKTPVGRGPSCWPWLSGALLAFTTSPFM